MLVQNITRGKHIFIQFLAYFKHFLSCIWMEGISVSSWNRNLICKNTHRRPVLLDIFTLPNLIGLIPLLIEEIHGCEYIFWRWEMPYEPQCNYRASITSQLRFNAAICCLSTQLLYYLKMEMIFNLKCSSIYNTHAYIEIRCNDFLLLFSGGMQSVINHLISWFFF